MKFNARITASMDRERFARSSRAPAASDRDPVPPSRRSTVDEKPHRILISPFSPVPLLGVQTEWKGATPL